MAVEITVPALGESITEAVIGKWNKKVGDAVKVDESLVVLETDKVTVEVPSPVAGVLVRIDFEPGSTVKVGVAIGAVDGGGAAVQAHPPAAVGPPAAMPALAMAAEPQHITPVARRLVEEKGLDAAQIKGTGPGGRIGKEDVLRHVVGDNGAVTASPMPAVEAHPPAQIPVPAPVSAPVARGPRPNTPREERVRMTPLRKRVAELGNKARGDKLTLDELRGGTFTISNGGIFGSMLSTPIINPPQTAILGMHNIVDRPVIRAGQIVARPIMYLALSYDHRLIDGREAVLFLVRIKEHIEDPGRLLLEV